MKLSPLPTHAIDRRLVRHLLPGETVLWQGAPSPGSIVSRFAPLTTVFTLIVGILLVLGYPPALFEWLWSLMHAVPQVNISIAAEHQDTARIVVGWFVLLTSVLGLLVMGYQRERHWVYAITNQRLLALNHGRVRHAATRQDVAQLRTLKRPFRGHTVYWSSSQEGFRGQREPQALEALIASWRKMQPGEYPSRDTTAEDVGARSDPPADAGNAASHGFRIEKQPAVWLALVGLVGAFGYWGYTAFLSGHEIASQDLQVITPYDDRPEPVAVFPDGVPSGYRAGPFDLEPAANPMRVVLGMTVRRARERVDYRVVLLDEAGVVAWESSGTAHHGASAEDKRQERTGTVKTKRMRQPTEPFTIERAGRYMLLADIERVDAPGVTLRGNVAEASSLVYAVFALIGLIGVGLLAREERERRRAAR